MSGISYPLAQGDVRGTLSGVHTQTATHASLLLRLGDAGDRTAWRDFVDRYGELIKRFSRQRGLQASDVDDVTQDVLASLTRAMPGFRYDPAKGKFRAYLKTVVVRAVAKRSCQKDPAASLERIDEVTRLHLDDSGVEAAWESEWRQHHVRTAMRTIAGEFNAKDLEVFRRYAVGQQDAAAVAESLGMSLDAVYQAKSRIMRRLSALIEEQIAEEG